jgi:hypothetical protein
MHLRTSKRLIFELRTQFVPANIALLEVTVAGILRDFGINEKTGSDAAAQLSEFCRELIESWNETSCEIVCIVSRTESEGVLTLHTDQELDLAAIADKIASSELWQQFIEAVKTDNGPGAFSVHLNLADQVE